MWQANHNHAIRPLSITRARRPAARLTAVTGQVPQRAFVLGGGGKWGAVQVGMLRALTEAGRTPDLILGTSVGAFNGAVYASDPTSAGVERIAALWQNVAEGGFGSRGPFGWLAALRRHRVAVNDPSALRALLEEALDGRRIEDLSVPFACVAASVERASEHWFTTGPVLPAVMASAAIPGLFPPVVIDGEHFYDGGLVNSIPLDRAVASGAREIYVLQVGRVEQALRPPRRFHESAMVAFEISRRHRFGASIAGVPEGVTVHMLPSAQVLAFDDRRQLRWTNLDDAAKLAQNAYESARAYLAAQEPPV